MVNDTIQGCFSTPYLAQKLTANDVAVPATLPLSLIPFTNEETLAQFRITRLRAARPRTPWEQMEVVVEEGERESEERVDTQRADSEVWRGESDVVRDSLARTAAVAAASPEITLCAIRSTSPCTVSQTF